LEVQADLDPTGELLMIYQPGDDRLDVWDREAGEVIWSAPRTGGHERFDDRTGDLLLPSATVDPRAGTSTPRPIAEATQGAEDTQGCAEVNGYSGPQAYDDTATRWAVVDSPSRQIKLVDYLPRQGSPEYPNLRCWPGLLEPAEEGALHDLDVLLTADARTIDFRRGLIAVGTSQDAVVLIEVDGPTVDAAGDDLVGRACDIAGRDLDRLEWSIYLPDWPYEPTCPAAVTGTSAGGEGPA
jgi:hypothetical protein